MELTYRGDGVVDSSGGAASEGHGDDGGTARSTGLREDPVETRDAAKDVRILLGKEMK